MKQGMADYHLHTTVSPDGMNTMEELCDAALEKGLEELAFTDHFEIYTPGFQGSKYSPLGKFTIPYLKQYRERFEQCQKEYGEKITLKSGIELGQPLQDLPVAEQILTRPYDMVIGSLHSISGHPDFYYLNYREMSKVEIDRLLSAYFEEMLRTVVWGKFDTLAHITYPFRYLVEQGVPFSLSSFDDQIGEVLRALAQSGKALEVNTSGLRQKIGQTLPPEKYLKRFRELGGEFVTIGSDAHRVEDVGSGIKEGYRILQKAGFSKLTYFEKRRPVLIKL